MLTIIIITSHLIGPHDVAMTKLSLASGGGGGGGGGGGEQE